MQISLLKAKLGEYRYIEKFLWFPKIQAGKLYWLEKVTVRQLYSGDFGIPKWIDVCISNPETKMPIHFPVEKDPHESIEVTKNRFINVGVYENKIITTTNPSACFWSLTRKCLVNENGIEAAELYEDDNGNKKLSYENNICVTLMIRSEFTKDDINKINNSEGIIITNTVYGKPYFRYGFIPIS